VPTPRKTGYLKILCCLGDARQGHFLGDDFAVRLAHRHAVAVRGAHHDALHHGLPADEGFLAAFEDGHQLNLREWNRAKLLWGYLARAKTRLAALPVEYIVETTAKCNLYCPMCPRETHKQPKADMSGRGLRAAGARIRPRRPST
jgi:hypothetical protein